jgi:hypothetical protein
MLYDKYLCRIGIFVFLVSFLRKDTEISDALVTLVSLVEQIGTFCHTLLDGLLIPLNLTCNLSMRILKSANSDN